MQITAGNLLAQRPDSTVDSDIANAIDAALTLGGSPDVASFTEESQYLWECVHINPDDIQGEFVRVPADLGYWHSRYAKAQRMFMLMRVELARTKALVRERVVKTLKVPGAKVTEGMIEAMVDLDDEWVAASHRLIETETAKLFLQGICESLRAKKDMIISLGAHLRVEMGGDPLVRDVKSGRR